MTTDKVTTEYVMLLEPCSEYTRERVSELLGDGLTPLQVIDLDIPAPDHLWVVLREPWISKRSARLLACRWAESVLSVYESVHPGDTRLRGVIETARRFANGEADETELDAARAAAWDAARAAAWAAEHKWQALRLSYYLRKGGSNAD